MYFSISILPSFGFKLAAESFDISDIYGIRLRDSEGGDASIHFQTREDAIAVIEAAQAEVRRMDADERAKAKAEADRAETERLAAELTEAEIDSAREGNAAGWVFPDGTPVNRPRTPPFVG